MIVSKRSVLSAILIVMMSGTAMAAAKQVKMKNKYSRDQINSYCEALGEKGLAGNTKGKSGSYDCINMDNGNSVSCDAKGNCVGHLN